MNKYWSSIICTAIICTTVLSYFIFLREDRFMYEKFGDKYLMRIDTKTGQTWVYKAGLKWEQVNNGDW